MSLVNRTQGSDFDVCLALPTCTTKDGELSVLFNIKLAVTKSLPKFKEVGVGQCSVINARVPILKFYVQHGHEVFDLSVNNLFGLSNTNLTAVFGSLDPRVPVLGRLLKRWAKVRGINDRYVIHYKCLSPC